ncbi:hypothetical protein [Butyrivibrio sp. INlla21]|uniref:hypothetical protein n=1 Tax=Butyrivibrio sp. INlla21 TaxID=1520811 RepID=UPI0008EB38DD|nr:hypothetical protein [Butyrivibrio sp. INlla21]SFU42386.1 hypothetical protein SAMN02910342_00443 [Butyrivibrio sp. INlla21]
MIKLLNKKIIIPVLALSMLFSAPAYATEKTNELPQNEAKTVETQNAVFTLGEIKDGAYENSFFNVRFPVLKGMKFDRDGKLTELGKKVSDPAAVNAIIDQINGSTPVILANATTNKSSVFTVIATYVGKNITDKYDEKSIVESKAKQVIDDYNNVGGFSDLNATIDSIAFLGEKHPSLNVTGKVDGVNFRQRFLCLTKDGYVMLFAIAGTNDSPFGLIDQATRLY